MYGDAGFFVSCRLDNDNCHDDGDGDGDGDDDDDTLFNKQTKMLSL